MMSTRGAFQAALCYLIVAGGLSPAQALTHQELVTKLEAAGYSQVRDIKSTAEGISVKAMKNGKDVSLVVDTNGQIKERQ
jgi:Peptidase propeptide and YPEB domain